MVLNRRIRVVTVILVSAVCSGLLGCAGYHVGNQFLYRCDIRTVHVEMIESNTYRRFLGVRLTEAIVKQIELNTPLTITEPALADSFVQGRLIQVNKSVLAENFSDEPRVLEIDFRLELKWVDRAGVPLMQRQLLRISRDTAFIPEGGQSMSTAQKELIERIAREFVGQMETPW